MMTTGTEDLTVRVAGEADGEALVRVINLAYRVEDFFIEGDRTDLGDVLARMARPEARFLVIDGEGPQLQAAVYMELRGDRGYVGLLSVDPAAQGRGHARRLLAAVEAHCRRAGCTGLDLDVVNLRTELTPFYLRLGFTKTGTAPFKDPQKLRRPAEMLLMSKAL